MTGSFVRDVSVKFQDRGPYLLPVDSLFAFHDPKSPTSSVESLSSLHWDVPCEHRVEDTVGAERYLM